MDPNTVVWTHDMGCGMKKRDLTIDWLQNALQRSTSSDRIQIAAICAERIAKNDGVLSDIIRVKITWNRKTSLPSSVTLKLFSFCCLEQISADISEDKKDIILDGNLVARLKTLHNQECDFYSIWSKETELPFRIPRCFYWEKFHDENSFGLLIFEDLSQIGSSPKFIDLLNEEQVLNVAEELAKFHAWCYLNPSKWENLFPLKPPENGDKEKRKAPSFFRLSCEKLRNAHPEELGELMHVALDVMDGADEVVESVVYSLRIPPVLVHKDCWMGNLIYEKHNDKDPVGNKLIAIVDWQTASSGSPSADLARLIWGSTTPKLRRNSTEAILKHYYKVLSSELEVPFTWEQFLESYKRMTPFAMSRGVAGAAENILSVSPLPLSDPLKTQKEKRIVHLVRCALEDAKEIIQKLEN